MIYLFLMERLNIVHSSIKHESITWRDRFKSWWYKIASVLLLLWVAVAIAMILGRNAILREDGTCKIGLKIWSTVPMLTVDAIVNIFLTTGFIMPVFKAGFQQAGSLVKNSCVAAVLALITSFVNILILAIMKGHQMSYVCLSSCVFDGKFSSFNGSYCSRVKSFRSLHRGLISSSLFFFTVAANATILFVITRHGSGADKTSMGSAYAAEARLKTSEISRRPDSTVVDPSMISRARSPSYPSSLEKGIYTFGGSSSSFSASSSSGGGAFGGASFPHLTFDDQHQRPFANMPRRHSHIGIFENGIKVSRSSHNSVDSFNSPAPPMISTANNNNGSITRPQHHLHHSRSHSHQSATTADRILCSPVIEYPEPAHTTTPVLGSGTDAEVQGGREDVDDQHEETSTSVTGRSDSSQGTTPTLTNEDARIDDAATTPSSDATATSPM